MAGNRKAAQDVILKALEMILPGGPNKKAYQAMFDRMTDTQFDEFIVKLEKKEIRLAILAPVLSSARLSTERNIEIGKRWGVTFFERLWIEQDDGLPRYLSNPSYMILELQGRRQAQLLIDKTAIPRDSSTIDVMTGQPAGVSKGGKLTYPEIQILKGHELNNTLRELLNTRGGNVAGFRAFNTLMETKGEASLEEIELANSEPESLKTLRMLYVGMMIDNDL